MALRIGYLSKNIFKEYYCTLFYTTTKNKIVMPHCLVISKQLSTESQTCEKRKSYEQKLPPMPAFPLKETLVKFIETCQPVLTKPEFETTTYLTDDFYEKDGPKLQKMLETAAKREQNWLASRWLKYGYLQMRDPLVVGTSPAMTFKHRFFINDDEWIQFTANAIYCILKFKELVDNIKLPLEKMGKIELDMGQYFAVLGTNRTPGLKEDTLEFNPDSQHIAVTYQNNWYYVPVYSKHGKMLPPERIFHALEACRCSGIPHNEKGIGILTAANRTLWATAYAELIKDKSNEENLKLIQSSLFTVSLDEKVTYNREDINEVLGVQILCGGGTGQNTSNRWFDKTIQFIVNRNGMNGFTYEHSPAEGQPVANMTGFIHKAVVDRLFLEAALPVGDAEPVRPLPFKLNSVVECYIDQAKCECDEIIKDLDLKVLVYQGYGKEFIKPYKLSPDSYCQMAMQCAYYKLYRTPGTQYESAHLRMYPGGRTETIRSCSNESAAFCKAMHDGSSSKVRWELLKKAVNGHREYTNLALQGKGVDRHIFGLKYMALEHNMKLHRFFKCVGVLKSADFRLYTSQVASPYEIFMCYGASTKDSYGCCYNPRPHNMIFAAGCWHSNYESDARRMAQAISESLDQMQKVLCEAGQTK